MNNNTIGVFHRKGTQVQFDPVQIADKIKRHREFYSGQVMDVRAFTYEGNQHTGSPTYARDDIDAFIAEGGTQGFTPHFRHILGGHKKPGKACGQAVQGAQESVSFDEFGCDSGDGTSLHELAHNGLGNGTPVMTGVGLGHSHSKRGDDIDQMGDWSSLQGAGPGEGLPSAMICALGWNRPEETIVVTKTQQVLVAPTEMAGLHPNEFKHCIIRTTGHNDYYLSARQDYPFELGERNDRGLYVHELMTTAHADLPGDFPNSTLLHGTLAFGEQMALPNGVTVGFVVEGDGIARAEVTFNGETADRISPIEALPVCGAAVESGCYYAPVSAGHGWDVHTHNGETVIYWYTGDASGRPIFMFAHGTAGAELDLFRMVGGTVDNPSGSVETKVGTCRFTGNIFSFRLEGVRGGIEVIPLVVPTESGIYYYPPRNGEGITAQIWDGGCAVFFYTYTHNLDAWYSCEGIWNGVFYDLVAYETNGAFHRFGAETKPVGKGQLVKLESGQVRFGFQAAGRDETYMMDFLF